MDKTIELKDKSQIPFTISYRVIRSNRKTCAIVLDENAAVSVRLPLRGTNADAVRFLREKQYWIADKRTKLLKQKEERLARQAGLTPLTQNQRTALEKRYREAAKSYFSQRAAYYTGTYRHIIRHGYSSISVRDQKTRWGSCSAKGALSFNWRLMLAPPNILDYVVVHELCHLEHLNHSKDFWECVEAILPDYRERRKWLKEHGHELTLDMEGVDSGLPG